MSRTVTLWPPSSSITASIAPTLPQPTITVRMLLQPRGVSPIGSRTTHTAQGAFENTYGMVRPIAKSPPKRFR